MNRFALIARYPENADSVELDLNEDFNISLNYQIEDILDISSRNTSYSKTVTLPGTPVNNKFFKHVFDVNIDNSILFNPSKRIPLVVNVDDQEIFNGVMQLLNVTSLQGDIQYEVTLFGKLKDILQLFNDASIKDLDLSEYDHYRNIGNVVNSTDYIVKVWGQDTDFNEPGHGYVYPYIVQNQEMRDAQFDFNADTIWNVPYAYPAVYLKTIVDKMFQFAGYTYTSKFFESDYFKKLIIPFTNDKIQLDEEGFNERKTVVGVNFSGSIQEFPGGPITEYKSITSSQILRGAPWYYNTPFYYFMPLEAEAFFGSNTLGGITFTDQLNQWDEYGGFTAANDGLYNVRMDLKLFPKYIYKEHEFSTQPQISIKYNGNGIFTYYYKIRKISTNGTITDLYSSQVPLTFSPSDNDWHGSPWYDLGVNGGQGLVFDGSADNVWLNAGDKIVLFFAARYPATNNTWASMPNDDVRLRMVIKQSYQGNFSYFSVEPSSNQSYGNDLIKLNETLPNIKMKDLFLDIVKMFNLSILDNKFKKDDLIIEPRDDFFASKNKVLNWEDEYKLDYDSEIKITPMSELDAKSYVFTYTADNDFLNEEYTNETGDVYGELQIDVENDFSQTTNTTKLLFSPTPNMDMYHNTYGASSPYFVTYDGINFKPKVVKPRLLFYDKIDIVAQYPWMTSPTFVVHNTVYGVTPTLPTISLNYIPYCGMWDHPSIPNYDLSFGKNKKIYFPSNTIPFNTLYEKFHKATLNNIIDKNARLLEAKFYLTPKDIADFDFRDIVFLMGSYWRVNKIKDYNPAGSDSLTTVILYKIVDINTYDPDNVEPPTSNDKCPTDVVAKKDKNGYVYVSQSGQEISQDCCKQIGGRWVDGFCRARRIIGLLPNEPIRYVKGGPGVFPIEDPNGPLVLQDGRNKNPGSSFIRGVENYIADGAGPSIVIGDNNSVNGGVDNAIIIGDGITADESNTIYLGNVKITEDGYIVPNKYYVIDGGEDEVMRVNKTNLIDVIDGTVDAIRNYGGDSKERPIIDGNITYNTPDTPEEA